MPTDVHKFLVGYRTSELGLFDVETGKIVTLMQPQDTLSSALRLHTQMNKVSKTQSNTETFLNHLYPTRWPVILTWNWLYQHTKIELSNFGISKAEPVRTA